jgi:hypothetical protein
MKTPKNESPNWSKTLIGALTLSAVMSALLLKLFSDLALADEPRAPTFTEPSQVLGTYVVDDIVEDSRTYKGSVCVEHTIERYNRDNTTRTERRRPDADCGKKIWVVRTGERIAIIDAAQSGRQLTSFLLRGIEKCSNSVAAASARRALGSSKLCQASHDPDTWDSRNDVYEFTLESHPLLATVGIMFMSGGVTSFEVALPKGVTVPDTFEIRRNVTAIVVFFPTSMDWSYKLRRVGD